MLAAAGDISTVAGTGTSNCKDYDGPATSATMADVVDVTLFHSGNLYITNRNCDIIMKVASSSGIITIIAGTNGSQGFSGDGGPATSSQIFSGRGIAVDDQENVFFADQLNHRIRKISGSTGIITTVAGIGPAEGSNEGGFSGDGGLATSALLNFPEDVEVDAAGNLYISDKENARIRKVTKSTGIITTVAGIDKVTGFSGDGGLATSAEINNPEGIALDSSGNIFISGAGHRIRKVTKSTGIITTVAGNGNFGFSGDGGQATSAQLASPEAVDVDSAGNIFIADSRNERIRMVTNSTGIITTVAGNGTFGYSGDGGPATSAQLSRPQGIVVDGFGNLFIADTGRGTVRKVNAVGAVTPEPNPIPGVTTWGLIGMAVLMAGAAFVMLRRRATSPA